MASMNNSNYKNQSWMHTLSFSTLKIKAPLMTLLKVKYSAYVFDLHILNKINII